MNTNNRLYNLPIDIQRKIYEYDDTYKVNFYEVIKQIKAKELSRVFRKFIVKQLNINRLDFKVINGELVETLHDPYNDPPNRFFNLNKFVLKQVRLFNLQMKWANQGQIIIWDGERL